MNVTMYPHKKLPKTAPGAATHPNHDISSVEIGPVFNGVSSDRSNGSDSDNQPNAQPTRTIIKLALFWENFEEIFLFLND